MPTERPTRKALLSRRELLGLAAAAAAAAATPSCGQTTGANGNETEDGDRRGIRMEAATRGRLTARPRAPDGAPPAPGLQPLESDGREAALLYVPHEYRHARRHPLVLAFHGAGGAPRNGLAPLLPIADDAGLILLAPKSRGATWDVILGGYGPDVARIDRALAEAFGRCSVDPRLVAIAGFSDGASYALSLGLSNGDLFRAVLAFSPGFSAPRERHGSPTVFVSHGTEDPVLPIARTSRRIVPQLRSDGYEVRYREFDGPHTVPPGIVSEAVAWLLSGARRAR